METKSQVDIKVSQDLIAPIIEAKVQAAIIEALGDERDLIERVVTAALTKKVETDRYSSKTIPWIEKVCNEVVRAAAEQAIKTWAGSQQDRIAEEFVRQLSQQRTSKSVVRAMIDGLADASKSRWKFSVELPE